MRLRFFAFLVLALAVVAGRIHASTPQQDSTAAVSKVLLRIGAPVDLAATQTEHTVWVINGDANISGTVLEQLVVINGTAHVQGVVRGNVMIMNGRLDLAAPAHVAGGVMLYRSTYTRAAGAEVS